MKVGIIGAGNVGSTLAMRLCESSIADVSLVDIKPDFARAKALDIQDASAIIGHSKKITGSENFDTLSDADIIVITAGVARKPGMSRDDLIEKNTSIFNDIFSKTGAFLKDKLLIVVTNPLDAMTYYAFKKNNFSKKKIIGMAGTLDSARLKNIVSDELGVDINKIKTHILGCHGDTMVPIISHTTIEEKPLSDIAAPEKLSKIIERTKRRGQEIVALLKTGSAYYSPSAGVFQIIQAIKENSNEILDVSCYLEGEYGFKGCFLGVPAEINAGGINKIVEFDLTDDEKSKLNTSFTKTKALLGKLKI